VPTTADAPTRYLKVAVYHTSSSDPAHQGCAAHGSNEHKAVDAALERLVQFRQAIENAFCCGASTDILLIGVDTDTDAIRVHIPDANGDLSAYRLVDNAVLYRETLELDADQARLAVYEAIRKASAQGGWGGGQGEPHEGMRRLVANLLINNLSQIEYVNELHGGRYPDIGHAERYISVGDGFEEVQMRNLAYYAHLHTVEEGAADLDVGIKIFKGLNVKHGLPVPVAIHYRYDARVPGARERAVVRATGGVGHEGPLPETGRRGNVALPFECAGPAHGQSDRRGDVVVKIMQVEKTLVSTNRIAELGHRPLLVVREKAGGGPPGGGGCHRLHPRRLGDLRGFVRRTRGGRHEGVPVGPHHRRHYRPLECGLTWRSCRSNPTWWPRGAYRV
jgi:hypothetical protein